MTIGDDAAPAWRCDEGKHALLDGEHDEEHVARDVLRDGQVEHRAAPAASSRDVLAQARDTSK